MAPKLNMRQARFVTEYLVDLNATKAAERAGYSPRTAYAQGSRLLTHAEVAAAIQAGVAKRQVRLELSADRVLQELMRVALVDLGGAYDAKGNLLPVHEMPEDVRRAIAGIKVFEEFDGFGEDRVKVGEVREVKFWPKVDALRDLGKHLKLFVERMEHTGKDGGPIKTEGGPFDLGSLTDEQLRQYRAIVAAGAAPAR